MFCTKCGSQNSENATFCNSCGSALAALVAPAQQFAPEPARFAPAEFARPDAPRWTPPPPPGAYAQSEQYRYAGFWIRFVAQFVDGLIIGIAGSIIAVPLIFAAIFGTGLGAVLQAGNGNDLPPEAVLPFVGFIFLFVVAVLAGQWFYFAYFESSESQATPGKKILGLKVIDVDGRRISFGRASGRFFGKLLSGALFNAGYIMAAFTARKQALHDMLASTLVIYR
ncbi:MAG: RDD family protein [Bryobacteraceae bacterium]|nr:RDD family protein [Bryobacteraceae bacterium]